jgi:pilus assembly protein CpaF
MSEFFASTVRHHLQPIIHLLDDPSVSEVMINGPDEVYIERAGKLVLVEDVNFEDEYALEAAVVNLAQFVGKRYDTHHPSFDGRLPDGSRVHVVGPPASHFIAVAIRKFSSDTLGPNDLIRSGTLSESAVDFLEAAVLLKRNFVVSGGTGSGKTTLLNCMASFIPERQRVVVIEDTSELQLSHDHVVRLEAVVPDNMGLGEVTLRDLLKSTLRLRPDRIVLGEVRGGEALDLLGALNSGHGGTMTTLHANSAKAALHKLETLVLFAGEDLPIPAIRSQIAGAVQIVIQISRFRDGSRRVEQIAELLPGLDAAGEYRVQTLFRFEGRGEHEGRILGELIPSGVVPSFMDEARERGVTLSPEWFARVATIPRSVED